MATDNDPHPDPHPNPHPEPGPRPPAPRPPGPPWDGPHPDDPHPWDGPHPGPDPWHPHPFPDPHPWEPHPIWGSPFPYPDGTWGINGTLWHFPTQELAWGWITSQHAVGVTSAPTPAETKELTDKLTALVNGPPYNGDYNAVFTHYAGPDNLVDTTGLTQLLKDAGISDSRIVLHFWVSGVMAQLDTNHDGKLSLAEIQAAIPPQPQP